jgi:eukaryotic-like serine/threonine-protein kinase
MLDHDARLRLGNYEPLLELAAGGMATVYVARQVGAGGFERLVVVKRVHRHLLLNRDFYDMFKDEGRIAAMLHHPNVVPVTDVVELDGELFLVMEYVESTSFATLLSATEAMDQRLPAGVVGRILCDTLAGLHAAHEAVDMRGHGLEIVHRDVSPQNVVVGIDGSSRLIDFGVAKARHRLTETRSGSLKGKYGYMAPEQAKARAVDRRADLFSAGVVLWEALAGKRLFRGDNEFDTMQRVIDQEIKPPSALAPNVSPGLDAVVLKALARDREERFQTAAAFIDALEHALPPVPARDVVAVVKAYCGDRLDERRRMLQGMLEGRVQPLSTVSSSGAGPRSRSTIAASPDSRDRMIRPVPDEGTEGRIAATRDAPTPKRGPSGRALAFGGMATLGLVVVAIAVVLSVVRRPRNAPIDVTARGAELAPDEVTLELVAESAIETVRTPGLRSSRVTGTTAHLVVSRWAGDLPIDAVLADGRPVHVVASSDGPRELALVPTAIAPPPADASAAPSASTPAPPSVRVPAAPPPMGGGGRPSPELHKSPYGP